MIILFACLGSFVAGIAVGIGIMWFQLERDAKRNFNQILKYILDK
mgnify:CR=1 FL=1